MFASDVEWFKDNYPVGYTEVIRDVVRQHILMVKGRYGSLKSPVFGEDL